MPAAEGSERRAARLLPVLAWAPTYRREWLIPDVVAGVTVSALVVPKALGYAGLSNAPLQAGLYAAAAGAILYALFGTSRQISTGPSSAPGAVAGSAVIVTGVTGGDAAALVAAITLAVGAIFVVMRVLKMGWISQFISKAVIVGFLFGAGIDVALGELSKITGTDADGDNAWQELHSWITGLSGHVHGTTLLVGAISLVALFGLKAVRPTFPGTLLVVVLGIAASALLDLGAHGVALVGDVPSGLPTPALPSWTLVRDNISEVMIAAVGIVMIGFSQSAGDARHFAAKHRYRVDVDQESLAQGAANVGAGLLQGIPVSTSLSASSLNDGAGAKTQLASLVTGLVVVLTLLVLAPLFSHLPQAVLGAVIIEAVISGMVDLPAIRRLWRVTRSDFWIAALAVVGVLTFGVLTGIAIGVALSVGWLVYKVTSPGMPALGHRPGTTDFRPLAGDPDREALAGFLILRLDGALFFATADALADRIRELQQDADPPVEAVILDCSSMDFIDSQGSETMGALVETARTHGTSLRLAHVKPAITDVLQRDGVLHRLRVDHIHTSVNDAVVAERASRA